MRKIHFVICLLTVFLLLGCCEVTAEARESAVEILLFYTNDCGYCGRVKNTILPQLEKKYPGSMQVKYYDIDIQANYELLIRLEQRYGVSGGSTPTMFIGTHCLIGREIGQNLEDLLVRYLQAPEDILWPEGLRSESKIVERFKSFGVLTVLGAGLIDGINPCAFAAIIYFISFLALHEYKKKEIIYVGSSFTVSVFLTYLLLGLGAFGILRKLEIFTVISRLIYLAIALLTLVLGIANLWDYIRYVRTGYTKGCSLKLHSRIQATMKAAEGKKTFIILISIALINGFVIALLESACTGQVYLPTIAFIISMPNLRLRAFLYLVLYNLMFIIPLVLVFLLAFIGVRSDKFSQLTQAHTGTIKLLTACLFLGLAAILIIVYY